MKVRISDPAKQQAGEIDRWWRVNRQTAPTLFAEEMANVRLLLGRTPELGSPYVKRGGVVVRRVLLPKSQNHVYYEIDRVNGIVMILAVWGAPKGRGPEL